MTHRVDQLIQHLEKAFEIGPEAMMRQSEIANGYQLLHPGDFSWLNGNDWAYPPIMSLDGKRVRIVAVLARNPGTGAFSRMITSIIQQGLRPCVLSPFLDMQLILERWNWRKVMVGTGMDTEERWPKQSRNGAIPIHKKKKTGLKPKDLIGIPWRVAFALQEDGWYLRQDIIWAKPNPMPESVTDRCTKAHEYLFLLSKGPKYYFDQEAILEPISESTAGDSRLTRPGYEAGGPERGFPGQASKGSGLLVRKSGNKERKYRKDKGGAPDHPGNQAFAFPWEGNMRNKRSVWEVATKPYTEAHFATFPPDLIEPCVRAGAPPKIGWVLDPFGGAGTTGLVADRHGRNAVLIELNPDYCDMARRRIQSDAPLFAEVS